MGTKQSRNQFGALLVAGVTLVLTAAPALAQDGTPLRKSDLIRMLAANTYTVTEVADIVRESCVDFDPTARDRSDLARLEGEPVLEVIAACRGTAAKPAARQIPKATPVRIDVGDGPDIEADPAWGDEDVALGADGLDPVPAGDLGAPANERVVGANELTTVSSPPSLANPGEVSEWLLRNYRPSTRRSGEVVLRMHVSSDGDVSFPEVVETSGDAMMDRTALGVIDIMKFNPAMSRGKAVGSWTIQRIVLNAR